MSNSLSNQYYLLRKGQAPIAWNIYEPTPLPEPEFFWLQSDYFAKVLQAVDRSLDIKNLIFYVTYDELHELPSYGRNVVVLMTGGEGCHIPRYFHKVLAIFKPFGIKPFLGYNPLLNPSYLSLLSFIQYLKTWIKRLPSYLNYYYIYWSNCFLLHSHNLPEIYTIPLGYYKQLELPIKDFKSRLYDVFFAGSLVNDSYTRGSFKYWITQWIKPPKTIARQQMIVRVNEIAKKHPNLNIKILKTPGFLSTDTPNSQNYSEQIMDAKICLDPRGTVFETYRFFEAMRYGCIIITEALPNHWFYDGSPAIQIQDWKYLGKILEELLENQDLMQKKHEETLRWWQAKCSDTATGEYIRNQLKLLAEKVKI